MLSVLRRPPFWLQIVVGLALGVVLGYIARAYDVPWLTGALETVGGVFVGLLKAAVPPLVFSAVVVSIANLRQVANAARLATQTLVWFMITSLVSVGIGLTLGLLTHPGRSAGVTAEGAAGYDGTTGSWLDFLTGLVPANFLGLSVADGQTSFSVLQIVVIALVIGAATLKAGEAAEPFVGFMRSALAVIQQVLWWIIKLAPVGTLGLIGNAVATYGWDLLGPLATFTIDVYVGCALVMFVVYPTIARLHGLSPAKYFSGAWPAIQLAFVSRSSVGTMPLTQRVTTRNLGVPLEYASFAVPFGATTKMDGCAAVYPALAAITVAEVFGVPLGVWDYVLIAFVSVIGSAATAGLTGAVVMLTLTLSTVGLPLEGVALLLAIDPILDMMRTATNVAGQALVPTIVAKREGILDLDAYNAPRGRDVLGDEPASVLPTPPREPVSVGT